MAAKVLGIYMNVNIIPHETTSNVLTPYASAILDAAGDIDILTAAKVNEKEKIKKRITYRYGVVSYTFSS